MILGVFLYVEELSSFKNARKFEIEEIKSNKKEPPALFQYHLNNQVQRFQLFESDNLHVNRCDSQHLAKS